MIVFSIVPVKRSEWNVRWGAKSVNSLTTCCEEWFEQLWDLCACICIIIPAPVLILYFELEPCFLWWGGKIERLQVEEVTQPLLCLDFCFSFFPFFISVVFLFKLYLFSKSSILPSNPSWLATLFGGDFAARPFVSFALNLFTSQNHIMTYDGHSGEVFPRTDKFCYFEKRLLICWCSVHPTS